MSQELLYTSAPHGLKPGSRGFCTVLSTQGMAAPLASALEGLSGYRPVFPTGDEQSELNPVNWSHLKLTVAGRTWHVLSRIAEYGLDYSQRSNKLAHHVVLDAGELITAGPATLLANPDFMRSEWNDEPQLVPPKPVHKIPPLPRGVCRAWQALAGDGGWAGVLAESFLRDPERPVILLYAPGQEVLPLIAEALSLIPPNRRWEVTFSTYFTGLPQGVNCTWRCMLSNSPEAHQSLRFVKALRLDLSTPETMGTPAGNELVADARGIPRLKPSSPSPLPPLPPAANAATPSDQSENATDETAEVDDTPPLPGDDVYTFRPSRRPPTQRRPRLPQTAAATNAEFSRRRKLVILIGAAGLALILLIGLGFKLISSPKAQVDRPVAEHDVPASPATPPSTSQPSAENQVAQGDKKTDEIPPPQVAPTPEPSPKPMSETLIGTESGTGPTKTSDKVEPVKVVVPGNNQPAPATGRVNFAGLEKLTPHQSDLVLYTEQIAFAPIAKFRLYSTNVVRLKLASAASAPNIADITESNSTTNAPFATLQVTHHSPASTADLANYEVSLSPKSETKKLNLLNWCELDVAWKADSPSNTVCFHPFPKTKFTFSKFHPASPAPTGASQKSRTLVAEWNTGFNCHDELFPPLHIESATLLVADKPVLFKSAADRDSTQHANGVATTIESEAFTFTMKDENDLPVDQLKVNLRLGVKGDVSTMKQFLVNLRIEGYSDFEKSILQHIKKQTPLDDEFTNHVRKIKDFLPPKNFNALLRKDDVEHLASQADDIIKHLNPTTVPPNPGTKPPPIDPMLAESIKRIGDRLERLKRAYSNFTTLQSNIQNSQIKSVKVYYELHSRSDKPRPVYLSREDTN